MPFLGSIDPSPVNGMPAIGVPLPNADPTREFIVTGPGRYTPNIPQLLSQEFDDVTRNFGHRTYEAMLTDPAVSSTYLAIKLAILAGPLKVMPAVKPKGFRGSAGAALAGSAKLTTDERMALETADFCERELKRLAAPPKATLLQLFDAMALGNKLAEKTREYVETGPDKGKLVLKSIKVKPAWAWKFVVNSHLDVVGILTYVPPMSSGGPLPDNSPAAAQGGFIILPRDKFALFCWMPKDNDPRGTSVLRSAYDWWNLKRQVMPHHYHHMKRFGSPWVKGTMPPNVTAGTTRRPIDQKTGIEIPAGPGAPGNVSEADRWTMQLTVMQNNSVIVVPNGGDVALLESSHDGEAFMKGFDLYDRQICLAIGLQARAQMEAKHGSKADSETAEDTRGLLIAYGREWAEDTVSREIFRESVRLNFGDEIAERLTPRLALPGVEHQDKVEQMKAAAAVGFQSDPSQWPEMDADLDLPERDAEAHQVLMETRLDAMKNPPEPPSGGQNGAAKGKPPAKASDKGAGK